MVTHLARAATQATLRKASAFARRRGRLVPIEFAKKPRLAHPALGGIATLLALILLSPEGFIHAAYGGTLPSVGHPVRLVPVPGSTQPPRRIERSIPSVPQNGFSSAPVQPPVATPLPAPPIPSVPQNGFSPTSAQSTGATPEQKHAIPSVPQNGFSPTSAQSTVPTSQGSQYAPQNPFSSPQQTIPDPQVATAPESSPSSVMAMPAATRNLLGRPLSGTSQAPYSVCIIDRAGHGCQLLSNSPIPGGTACYCGQYTGLVR